MTTQRIACLAAGLLFSASAHAVILWDEDVAAQFGVERPADWMPEADCHLEITSPTQATAGTTGTFDVYSVSSYGVVSPFAGVKASIFDTSYHLLQQIDVPMPAEDEANNLPAILAYSSAQPATHYVALYQPESLDYYSYWDESTYTAHPIGIRWCEGMATVSWVPAVEDTASDRKVTGGGWLEPKRRMFSLVAQAKAGETVPRGQFTYVDTTANVSFRSHELLSLQVSGNTAYLQAKGELEDGSIATATVIAADNGEPGTLDTLDVTIGYHHSTGALAGGDIQVH